CCLKYEQNAYDDLLKTTPKQGAIVKTTSGRGVVEEVNLLTGKLKVKLDNNDTVTTFDKSEVEVIKDSVIRVDRNEMKALKSLEGQ
ncbi:MAG TPA: stage 0 sporulation protein, partial [Ruminococcaceae bacterium]|nr:stage 0 sporulation protein [Oscillospiraceae bacterium]